jgi:Arc/MetJ family transcription regulator
MSDAIQVIASWIASMRTNIVIDDKLIKQAMQATGLTTKRAVVEAGLCLLVQIHEQGKIRRLRGKITWEGDLEERRAARGPEI